MGLKCSPFPEQNLIYTLSDPDSKMIRYVGLTTIGIKRPERHLDFNYIKKKETHCARWIKRLLKEGKEPIIDILESGFTEFDRLTAAEKFYIAYFKLLNYPLTNMTDGGEGASGAKRSEETRRKMSESRKRYLRENPMTQETKNKIGKNSKKRWEAGEFLGIDRSKPRYKRRMLTPVQHSEVLTLFKQGVPQSTIARQMGIKKSTVRNVIFKWK